MSSRIHDSQRDSLTGFPVVLQGDHTYIHRGKAFSLPIAISALAADASYNIGFTTPNRGNGSPMIHWRPTEFSSTANAVRLKLYQGSAFSDGTLEIPRNRNQYGSELGAGIIKNPVMPIYTNVTASLTNTVIVNAEAGGGFANQPAGGKVTAVSDNETDIGQTLTVYGTVTDKTTTVTTNIITLKGTTAVDSALATFQNILGAELSAKCAGTITLSSADGAIFTISADTLSAGIEIPKSTIGYNEVPRHDASGASTAPVGVIGTSYDDSVITSVDALNGETEEAHNSTPFKTINKVLIGAVAADINVTILVPDHAVDTYSVGTAGNSSRAGGSGGANQELILEPGTSYVLNVKNIGSVTATDVDLNVFYYEVVV
jgi:hypothetical protein